MFDNLCFHVSCAHTHTLCFCKLIPSRIGCEGGMQLTSVSGGRVSALWLNRIYVAFLKFEKDSFDKLN